jgi:AraC-like DNA-binding protein
MKVKQEKIFLPAQAAFKAIRYSVPFFNMPYHFHSEYELVYINAGSGTRYIGDTVQKFAAGDMVFMGPDLAHLWINPRKYHEQDSSLKVEATVIQFSRELLESLVDLPEFTRVKHFLEASQQGFIIKGETREHTLSLIEVLLKAQGVQRIVLLLQVLDVLSLSNHIQQLNFSASATPQTHQDQRVDRVHQFVQSCYDQALSCRDAARLINMEQAAFCRFFKGQTQKTFTQYLNETRIDKACQLLLRGGQSVTQVAYSAGFGNLANFYRQFKRIMGTTPRRFLRD